MLTISTYVSYAVFILLGIHFMLVLLNVFVYNFFLCFYHYLEDTYIVKIIPKEKTFYTNTQISKIYFKILRKSHDFNPRKKLTQIINI